MSSSFIIKRIKEKENYVFIFQDKKQINKHNQESCLLEICDSTHQKGPVVSEGQN